MNVLLSLMWLFCVQEPAPEKYDLSRTGIPWVKGLDAALNKGKPILLFQLLGEFDDVHC